MASEFVYAQPVKIYFGEGQFARLGEILSELGSKRCVIACGKHFAPEAEKLRETIGAIVGVFGGVEQNPQLSGIEQTVRLCRELEADTVIGIGGGSSLDTAKFAAAVTRGEGEPLEYYRGVRPFPAERLTIVAVPPPERAARSRRSPSCPTARRRRPSTTRSSCRAPRSSIPCCPPPCRRARR